MFRTVALTQLLNQQKLPVMVGLISTRMFAPSPKDLNIFTQKNKTWCIRTMDCYTALKKQKSEPQRPAWLEQRGVMVSDHRKSQSVPTRPCRLDDLF